MKDFVINLGLLVILLVPIYGIMLALAFISEGNVLGFAISIIVALVAAIIIRRVLRNNNNKTTKQL